MSETNLCQGRRHNKIYSGHQSGRGPSSYWMQDPDLVFGELHLKKGDSFLDIGCGTGDYTLRAALEVGRTGMVCATDVQSGLIESLMERAQTEGLVNIHAVVSDIHSPLPCETSCIDLCFVSTVLHSLDMNLLGPFLFNEIKRVLKPDGRLVIIECNKDDLSFGPPLHMRISADELEQCISSYGFMRISHLDLGFNYLSIFSSKM